MSWLPELPDGLWFAMLWTGAAAAVLLTVGLCDPRGGGDDVRRGRVQHPPERDPLPPQPGVPGHRARRPGAPAGGPGPVARRRAAAVAAAGSAPGRRAALAAVAAPGPGRPRLPRVRVRQARRPRLVRWPRAVGPDGAPPARPRPDAPADVGHRPADVALAVLRHRTGDRRHRAVHRCRALVRPHPSGGDLDRPRLPRRDRGQRPRAGVQLHRDRRARDLGHAVDARPPGRARRRPVTGRTRRHARAGRRLVRPLPCRRHRPGGIAHHRRRS